MKKNNNILVYIGTFLWPFVGLIYSAFNWRKPLLKNVIWIFSVYFGLVFIYFIEGVDAVGYAKELGDAASLNFTEAFQNYFQKGGNIDIYTTTITIILSRLTTNTHILFAVYAAIFGFFYSRNIDFVIKYLNKNNALYVSLFFLLYILINPIWNINIVRFFTAAQVFVYGAMPSVFGNHKRKLHWVLISLLIHWSFIFVVIAFIIWNFTPKNLHIYFGIYLISLFVNTLDLGFVNLENWGVLGGRIGLYANEDAIGRYDEAMEALGWHVKLSKEIMHFIIQLTIIALYFIIRIRYKRTTPFIRLYTFSLLIYSMSRLLQTFNYPEAYRLVDLSLMFVLPVIIFIISYLPKKSLRVKFLLLSIPLVFTITFRIRIGMDYYGISLILGNFISAAFVEDISPLITFFKNYF